MKNCALLPAVGKQNSFTQFHTTWEEPFSAALYLVGFVRLAIAEQTESEEREGKIEIARSDPSSIGPPSYRNGIIFYCLIGRSSTDGKSVQCAPKAAKSTWSHAHMSEVWNESLGYVQTDHFLS